MILMSFEITINYIFRYIQIEKSYFKYFKMLLFCCILDQINAGLVNRRDFFKHESYYSETFDCSEKAIFIFLLFIDFNWLRNQIHCRTITNINDLSMYYSTNFFYYIRKNIFHAVINAMSLALYCSYTLFITWRWLEKLNKPHRMFNIFMFPNVSVFPWTQLLSHSDSWSYCQY